MGLEAHLSRLADSKQVQPVVIPEIDDLGQFPALLRYFLTCCCGSTPETTMKIQALKPMIRNREPEERASGQDEVLTQKIACHVELKECDS
ncbi:hypothetical protein NDU88_006683 [Pleurodeles waltl]|uniref:Uncharacterized protein n=1 Tax=Pleurodeles waltl TaxID=8319 RepID=A0AAV7UMA4_PLEWA|nr:hypothetical protein NDU88_006683 [Pleurodeles waltl]